MLIVPHLILKKDGKILLIKRSKSSKIWSGNWHCVTGKIENNESPKEAIIRETKEEIGVTLDKIDLGVTVFLIEKDYFDSSKEFYGLELFFVSDLPDGQVPKNIEPLKQDAIGWFDPSELPMPIIPGVKFGIESHVKGLNYAELRNKSCF